MANEITITGSITASKGGASVSSGSISKTFDMTGDAFSAIVQTILSAAWANDAGHTITIPAAIGTPGTMVMKNLDSTNFVQVALDSAGSHIFAKILAGQCMVLPCGASAYYAKADTDDVNVQVWLVEV